MNNKYVGMSSKKATSYFLKKTITIFAFTIALAGGSDVNNRGNVYLYGSKAYVLKEENARISLKQAYDIVCSSHLYRPFLQHFLMYQDDYIFTQLPPTHAGTLKLTEGLRVSSVTGEAGVINPTTYPDTHVSVGRSKPLQCP
jgi:hypothetical protein